MVKLLNELLPELDKVYRQVFQQFLLLELDMVLGLDDQLVLDMVL